MGDSIADSESLTIRITDEEYLENLDDAIGFVEEELGKELHGERGRAPEDKISLQDAINEMAVAYSGKK